VEDETLLSVAQLLVNMEEHVKQAPSKTAGGRRGVPTTVSRRLQNFECSGAKAAPPLAHVYVPLLRPAQHVLVGGVVPRTHAVGGGAMMHADGVCVCVCVCMHIRLYACMYVCACVCVCIYVRIFVCIYVCMDVCMCIYCRL
jgi:hypothetical protein